MNILLWIFQIILALHTAIGAFWKFSHSEQSVPSLAAIPHTLWLALVGIELFCSLALILPAFKKSLNLFAPLGAACIAAEMILFAVVHICSGDTTRGPLIYWLVVAAICIWIVYGRAFRQARNLTPRK